MPFSLERWIKEYPGILTVEAKLSVSQVSVNAKTDMFICDNKRLTSGSLLFRLRQFRWQKKIDWNISGFLRSHAIARDLYRSLRKWRLSLSNSNRRPNPPHLTTHVHHYNIQWGLSSRLPDSQRLSHVLKNLWC